MSSSWSPPDTSHRTLVSVSDFETQPKGESPLKSLPIAIKIMTFIVVTIKSCPVRFGAFGWQTGRQRRAIILLVHFLGYSMFLSGWSIKWDNYSAIWEHSGTLYWRAKRVANVEDFVFFSNYWQRFKALLPVDEVLCIYGGVISSVYLRLVLWVCPSRR